MGRKMKRINVLLMCILGLLLAATALNSQDATFVKRISALEGRHFLLGFMQNEIEECTTDVFTRVFVTSRDTTLFTVTDKFSGTQSFTVLPDQVVTVIIDNNIINSTSEKAKDYTIEITSEKPVSVFAFCSRYLTSDSYTAVPISRWGTEYVVVSMPNDQYAARVEGYDSTEAKKPRRSEFMLLAATDGTEIAFTPTVNTDEGVAAGVEKKITLNKGQCYLVKSAGYPMGGGDLSGTIITGNKPFGVLSGHVRTAVRQGLGHPKDSKDHLIDMLMPVPNWGQKFATACFGINDKVGDYFKLTSYYDNTVVNYSSESGSGTLTMAKGGESAVVFGIYTPAYWESNKPVQLSQIMMHGGGNNESTFYDPSLVTIPPVEQYIQKVTITTQGNDPTNPYQYLAHYLYLVCDSAAVNNITYDKIPVQDFEDLPNQIVPGTKIHYAQFKIAKGVHTIETAKGSFTGALYGTGNADSYAMILGIGMIDPAKPDTNAAVVTATDSCGVVTGVISDVTGDYVSGLDYVKIKADETFNFDCTVGYVTDTSTVVGFSGRPVDILKDGRMALEIKDKEGNFRWYRYYYNGLAIKLNKDKVEYSNIDHQGENTELLNFEYYGKDSMVVNNIYLKNGDPRLTLDIQNTFPFWVKAGAQFDYSLTYSPKGDISDLSDVIVIDLGCGKYVEIPVSGNVLKHTLVVEGSDFGDVIVGETVQRSVQVTNTGNTPVTLSGLDILNYTGCFSYDSSSKFPKVMDPGDIYRILVYFTPKDRIVYTDSGSFLNNYSISNTFLVKGRGIAPLVQSVKIDWGNRRVGTKNDTLLLLQNTGNDHGRLVFSKYTAKDPEIDGATLQSVNNIITIGDTLPLNVSFSPLTTTAHRLAADLTMTWLLHDTVRVELTGTGTLPEVKTYDVNFGTVEVYDSGTLNPLMIETGGNEDLTVDDVYIVGEIDTSFKLGPTLKALLGHSGPQKLQPGYKLQEDVTFAPDKSGNHEMIIELLHDAAPAYQRLASRIRLTGFSDYTRVESYLVMPDSIIACRTFETGVVVRNTGMVDLKIQQLELTHGNSDIELDWVKDYPSMIPVTIEVDSMYTFLMKGLAKKGETDEVFIKMKMNDTIQTQLSYTIDPLASQFAIAGMSDYTASIGDTVTMIFSGSFSRGTELPVRFNLVLNNLLKQLYYQISPDVLLTISDGKGQKTTYPLSVVQDAEKLTLDYSQPLMLPAEGCTWSFTLVFKTLLGTELGSTVTTLGDYSECFDNDSINFFAGVNQVCMYKYSGVTLIEVPLTVKTSPNPSSGRIRVEVELSRDEAVDVAVTDNSGKQSILCSGIALKKGSHILTFDNAGLSAGVYMISVRTQSAIVSTRLIIEK